MTPDEKWMTTYRLKNRIQGVEIDGAWQAFLLKELNFTKAPIGDYFYYDVAGRPDILPKVTFERMFELDE